MGLQVKLHKSSTEGQNRGLSQQRGKPLRTRLCWAPLQAEGQLGAPASGMGHWGRTAGPREPPSPSGEEPALEKARFGSQLPWQHLDSGHELPSCGANPSSGGERCRGDSAGVGLAKPLFDGARP